jgi:hypothetical protein
MPGPGPPLLLRLLPPLLLKLVMRPAVRTLGRALRSYAMQASEGVPKAAEAAQRPPAWVTRPQNEPAPERPWGGRMRGMATYTLLPGTSSAAARVRT